MLKFNFFLMLLFSFSVYSGSLNFSLKDQHSNKIKKGVIILYPTTKTTIVAPEKKKVVEQKDKRFTPQITPVVIGTTVSFPNHDDTEHSVYSFSDAKKFNLSLYNKSDKVPEVTFEKEGVVVMGCNIHDWMVGYVLVLSTPHFSNISDGHASIKNIPNGKYRVKFWTPEENVFEILDVKKTVNVVGDMTAELSLNIFNSADFQDL